MFSGEVAGLLLLIACILTLILFLYHIDEGYLTIVAFIPLALWLCYMSVFIGIRLYKIDQAVKQIEHYIEIETDDLKYRDLDK